MFYSHEVLTSRKYGIATVWLVATLGANSSLRKIKRKAILEVDVQKACRAIIDPVAPMALRLQGNLLYGVARVYLQQCGYMLSDAQHASNQVHLMLKSAKNVGLDPEAGKAKPEQLLLPDDPDFLPELQFPPLELLSELHLPVPMSVSRSGDSQSLTPYGSRNGIATSQRPAGGLVLPSSPSLHGMGEFGVQGDDESTVLAAPGVGPAGTFLEPDFSFDDEGNFLDLATNEAVPVTPGPPAGATEHSDRASSRVRNEHEEGLLAGQQVSGDRMDIDLPVYGDELPEGEEFPLGTQPRSARNEQVMASSSSAIVGASLRRKSRAPRVIKPDRTVELRSRDLADWNNNYLRNMKEASKAKHQHRAAIQAKKNAEYWVWGSGIGGIGLPFDRYLGDRLFGLLITSPRNGLAGSKHDRDSGYEDEETRRVRQKADDRQEQAGRADDEGLFFDDDAEVELPRDAPAALDDQHLFSAMPWNMSVSARGSSVVPRSGQSRGSRMVSASPLHGRGQSGGLQALRSLEGEDEFGDLGLGDFDFGAGPDHDSASLQAEEVAQPSLRVREALSAEGENFLAFVAEAITERQTEEMSFEDLLPPTENNKTVAAQGLMMVLLLGTKGLLKVCQEEDMPYGKIGLSIV